MSRDNRKRRERFTYDDRALERRLEPRFEARRETTAPSAEASRDVAATPPPAYVPPAPRDIPAAPPRDIPAAPPREIETPRAAEMPRPAHASVEPPVAPRPTPNPAAAATPLPDERAAGTRASLWAKIQVPEGERERAAQAGLYRYVKGAPIQEEPRKPRPAPDKRAAHAPMPTGGGKPGIWLTVMALLLLFGAGAYGLSWIAGAPRVNQSADWRAPAGANMAEPAAPSPAAPPPAPTADPRFIEVAP